VVNRNDERPFDVEDSDLLLSFASMAAIAIENARLFTSTDQALQARLEELMTIQYIDRQLNATLDYRKVMDQTLEWAIRITHATIGLICAFNETDDGEKGLRFLAHQGYSDVDFARYSDRELWPLDQGIVGQTVTLGETLLERNVQNNPYYAALVPDMQAQLTVPIKREGRVTGAIVLESGVAESFTDENVAFIQRLADHAAIAIENARLFQEVQQANAAKTQFVSFVSHELKQPMTSINGYCELLAKEVAGALNPQQQHFVSIIHNSVERMDHLVQELMDVSRIESGQMRLDMGPVAPGDVVHQTVESFQQALKEKRQTLTVSIADNLPVISGDKERLVQVLTNLLSNAHKYTPDGGEIVVSAAPYEEEGRDYICWSVKDSGIGMSREELDKLFTKFFRSERSIVRNSPGTGLGLAISQSIIQLHGGSITAASTYQQGSVFSFTVPVIYID
ncbi:MAG: ATP-binding protein, partial [Anaerolineae bacterium]|nr:ATP-binding protein [Anaerolineae bacterium]